MVVALGAIFALGGFCVYTRWYDQSAKAGKAWAQRENYRRLPIACLASPWYVFICTWHIRKDVDFLKHGYLAFLARLDVSSYHLSSRTGVWRVLFRTWLPTDIHEYAKLYHGCLS